MTEINPNDILVMPWAALLGYICVTWIFGGDNKVLEYADNAMGFVFGVTACLTIYHIDCVAEPYNPLIISLAFIPTSIAVVIYYISANLKFWSRHRAILAFVSAQFLAVVYCSFMYYLHKLAF